MAAEGVGKAVQGAPHEQLAGSLRWGTQEYACAMQVLQWPRFCVVSTSTPPEPPSLAGGVTSTLSTLASIEALVMVGAPGTLQWQAEQQAPDVQLSSCLPIGCCFTFSECAQQRAAVQQWQQQGAHLGVV